MVQIVRAFTVRFLFMGLAMWLAQHFVGTWLAVIMFVLMTPSFVISGAMRNWYRDDAVKAQYDRAWRELRRTGPGGGVEWAFVPRADQESGFAVFLADHRQTGISASAWLRQVFFDGDERPQEQL